METNIPELASCQRCALSKTRTRVVIGSGPDSPSLMVIGEAPGKNEDEGGEPFIGRSGQLLFRLLEEETGLLRSDCFARESYFFRTSEGNGDVSPRRRTSPRP